jgi:hypothetical protein
MNLDLCKYWGFTDSLNEDEWIELYSQKLFDLKKMVLEQIYLPKLIRKRLEECQRIIQIQYPEKLVMFIDQYQFSDLNAFERDMASTKLMIHRSMDFEDLFIGLHHVLAVLEAYRDLIMQYTNQWEGEWNNVEVNSREIFPSGLFLQSLKDGKTLADWKETLLKERKRITIVF